MSWVKLVIALAVAAAVFLTLGLLVARALSRREPYRSILRLKTRQKLRFLKSLLTDRRVPLKAKLVPVLLVAYLAMPFDLIPDFLPGIGYLDDVVIVVLALALFIRLCPRAVVQELLTESAAERSGAA
ncbi:MAG: YkvA family protein [Chloroflexota bacterium]|nr:YkvA family protein [Chloroflexota bacterium]